MSGIPPGPPSAGLPPQPMQAPPQHGPPPAPVPQGGPPNQQNLNQIVLEYLNKKGYSKTENMLRKEAQQLDADGRPIIQRVEDTGGAKFRTSFELLRTWIDENLNLYKPELRKLLWPIFVYSLIQLAADHYQKECGEFITGYKDMFAMDHAEDLRELQNIRLPSHVTSSSRAQLYQKNKYRLTLSTMAFTNLIQFLEAKEREGGSVIISLITNHMDLRTRDRRPAGDEKSLAAMLARGDMDDDLPDEDEGIPGHNPGSANLDKNAPKVLPKLTLGSLAPEQDLQDDVRAELQDRDAQAPPGPGQSSLIDEYEKLIKSEPTDDAPSRDTIPLPPSMARDVVMEVQKVIEHRDRFRIPGRTGGTGPGVSITMFTFHNTFESINCLDFSGDCLLVAAGTEQSYIRIWSLDGEPLPSILSSESGKPPVNSRRLTGHSGPVYSVSFSPSIKNPNSSGPPTGPRYLLSSSADKSIRLWSIDTWTCLVAYKGHVGPIWNVTWGPFGHYFLTGSHDKTAKLWSTEHIQPLKWFVGHDEDVDCVAFHPNNLYIFTGSCDRTVRMWHISSGNNLRLFTGHKGNITAIACSPDGKTLASADDAGDIILWDLEKGRRRKRMQGHGPGGIWSLSWSVESTVLVSAGSDATVRVWDVLMETSDSKAAAATAGAQPPGTRLPDGTTTTKETAVVTTDSTAPGAGGTTATGKKKKKGKGTEKVVSPDQISAFPTKKSPVYKVAFTRMNLVLAGGAYLP